MKNFPLLQIGGRSSSFSEILIILPGLARGNQVIHIPMQLRRRGGRKVIITPGGADSTAPAMPDEPVVQAMIKARRWQTMLESGEVAIIKELAEKEGVDRSCMARTVCLNLLAPTIVDAILAGNYPDTCGKKFSPLQKNLKNFLLPWSCPLRAP